MPGRCPTTSHDDRPMQNRPAGRLSEFPALGQLNRQTEVVYIGTLINTPNANNITMGDLICVRDSFLPDSPVCVSRRLSLRSVMWGRPKRYIYIPLHKGKSRNVHLTFFHLSRLTIQLAVLCVSAYTVTSYENVDHCCVGGAYWNNAQLLHI